LKPLQIYGQIIPIANLHLRVSAHAEKVSLVPVERESPIVARNCGFESPEVEEGQAATRKCLGIERFEFDCLVIACDGGRELLHIEEGVSAIVKCVRILWLECDGSPEIFQGSVIPLLFRQQISTAEIGLGEVRVDGDGSVEIWRRMIDQIQK